MAITYLLHLSCVVQCISRSLHNHCMYLSDVGTVHIHLTQIPQYHTYNKTNDMTSDTT